MKLGEALILRGDLQKRMTHIRERTSRNAVVQEGGVPAEDPSKLIAEYEACADELERMIIKINSTNI